jgi:hypothetical protein
MTMNFRSRIIQDQTFTGNVASKSYSDNFTSTLGLMASPRTAPISPDSRRPPNPSHIGRPQTCESEHQTRNCNRLPSSPHGSDHALPCHVWHKFQLPQGLPANGGIPNSIDEWSSSVPAKALKMNDMRRSVVLWDSVKICPILPFRWVPTVWDQDALSFAAAALH